MKSSCTLYNHPAGTSFADLYLTLIENLCSDIAVLPGAFSAYRYIALQNDSIGEGLLLKYFLDESMGRAFLRMTQCAMFTELIVFQ